MSQRDVLNFAPTGEKKRRKIPVYAGLIVVACLILFAGSVLAILAANNFDIGKALGARQPEEATNDEKLTVITDESFTDENISDESVNFLLLCSDTKELTFCQIISVNEASGEIKIKPIPADYEIGSGPSKAAVGAMYGKSSYKEICDAFSSRGIRISRYVHITEDNFKRLMSNLGQVPVEINGYYEFNIDAVRYTFVPGVQNMTSDTLLKYMKFAADGEDMLYLQGHAVGNIFAEHFTAANFEKGDSFFSKLINYVDTDINVFDYNAVRGKVGKLTSDGVKISVVS